MVYTIVGKKWLRTQDITADYDKARKVLKGNEQHSKALLTMVHFTNRELSEDVSNVTRWKPEWQKYIVVGRNNIEAVTGPFYGRLLTSSGLYGTKTKKSFSTLATRAVSVFYRMLRQK